MEKENGVDEYESPDNPTRQVSIIKTDCAVHVISAYKEDSMQFLVDKAVYIFDKIKEVDNAR